MLTPESNCDALHGHARSSVRMLRKLTLPVGIQHGGERPLALGNCPVCRTTLAVVLSPDEERLERCPDCGHAVSSIEEHRCNPEVTDVNLCKACGYPVKTGETCVCEVIR